MTMKKLAAACLLLVLAGCGRGKATGDWIKQLKDPDVALRLEAVKALGDQRAEAAVAVPALAAALQDGNYYVRRDAAKALGKFGADARPALGALLEAVQDQERSVRTAAVRALKTIDPEAAARAGVP